jgi:predicted ATPase
MNNLTNDKDLHQALERVHDEVDKAENLDEHGRQLLGELDGHVQDLLDGSEVAAMKSSLEQAIRHFEVTHPELTAVLSDLLTALSNAGI